MDSHTTVQESVGTALSTELPTDYHHIKQHHIVERSLVCVCGRSGKNFPVGSYPRH